jgi:chromate transporter
LNWYTVWIPVVCALAIWALGVSPIYIIIIAGLAGYLYGRFVQGDKDTSKQGVQDK